MKVGRRSILDAIRPSLPWIVLGAGLGLATAPTWRPLLFGVALALEDLTSLRCPSR